MTIEQQYKELQTQYNLLFTEKLRGIVKMIVIVAVIKGALGGLAIWWICGLFGLNWQYVVAFCLLWAALMI